MSELRVNVEVMEEEGFQGTELSRTPVRRGSACSASSMGSVADVASGSASTSKKRQREEANEDGDEVQTKSIWVLRKELEQYAMSESAKINKTAFKFISNKVGEYEQLITELQKEVAVLKARLDEKNEIIEKIVPEMFSGINKRAEKNKATKVDSGPAPSPKGTYARAVASKPKSNVVIIHPTEKENAPKGPELKEKIVKSLENEFKTVRVKTVRQLGDRGVLIETPTANELNGFKTSKKMKEAGFSARDPICAGPKVLFYDISRETEELEFIENLYAKNLKEAGFKEDTKRDIKIRFKVGPKDKPVSHWVVEVPGPVFKAISTQDRVYLGMSAHRFREFMDAPRCFKCQGYGHRAAFCKKAATICGHCAQEGHKFQECPNKGKDAICCNCKARNRKSNHMVTDAGCPERARAYEMARIAINYE